MNANPMANDHVLSAARATDSSMAPPAGEAARRISKTARWAGRILSGVVVLFLSFDAAIHLIAPSFAVEGTVKLGYPAAMLPILGVLQVVFLALYLVRRTSILGAVLWTGYLGGAVATHVRAGDPLFSHVLVPVYVAALLWGGLWLRDARLRDALR